MWRLFVVFGISAGSTFSWADPLPPGESALATRVQSKKTASGALQGTVIEPTANSNSPVSQIADALSNAGARSNSNSAGKSTSATGGDCSAEPSGEMMSEFQRCGGNRGGGPYMLADIDNKVAFVFDANGKRTCLPIIVGENSQGNPANLSGAAGSKMTRSGMFRSQPHEGAKYSSSSSNVDKDAIGIGDPTGRVIHSAHANRTTWGCIGIDGNPKSKANADANFKFVKDTLGLGGSTIFVWGKQATGTCGSAPGRQNYRPGVDTTNIDETPVESGRK